MAKNLQELTAPQLARHAFNVFLFSGPHRNGAQLIYRALELAPYDALALRCLSDLLDTEGTEVFSAIVLEYALQAESPLDIDERRELDQRRFVAKWSWGFAHHRSGEATLPPGAFAERWSFTVDDDRYRAFVAPVAQRAGNWVGAFRSAHCLCGVMAGFLLHSTLRADVGIEEAFHPERFARDDAAYNAWLLSGTGELDQLEFERQRRTGVDRFAPLEP